MAWSPGHSSGARRPKPALLSLSLLLLLLLLSPLHHSTWNRYLYCIYYFDSAYCFNDEPRAGSRQPSVSSLSTGPVPYCPGSGQAVLFNTLPGPDITEKVIYRYHALYHHLGPFGPSTN